MNPEVKDKWVTALESGEYKQTKGQLHIKKDNEDKFCCLGVLCELAVEDGVIGAPAASDDDPDSISYAYNGHGAFLPEDVIQWAGLDSDSPMAGGRSLVVMNDDGRNFLEIAEQIKEHL